jgi:hypothetical protein
MPFVGLGRALKVFFRDRLRVANRLKSRLLISHIFTHAKKWPRCKGIEKSSQL